MTKWVEGIHYQKVNGQLECLKCHRKISSLPGLGPHLSSCYGRGEPPSDRVSASGPSERPEYGDLDEQEALVETLKKFGVKRPEGIADYVAKFGLKNLYRLDEALRLARINPGKRKLIVGVWSEEVQEPVPSLLEQTWTQREQPPLQLGGEAALTEERLIEILDKRDQDKAKENETMAIKQRLTRLESGDANPDKFEELRKEIQSMRDNEVMKRLSNLETRVTGSIATNNPTVQAIKSLENIVVGVKHDIQGWMRPLSYYLITGEQPQFLVQRAPKEVEPGARDGLAGRVPSEYVAAE